MNNLISIIMPAYNAQNTISEAINSVLAQTYTNLELIIINDFSTDKTKEIIQSFNDNRIKYIQNDDNLGVAKSRNKGVELSSGEWVAFLDADDVWLPDKLSKQLKFAEENNAKITYTASAFMDGNGKKFGYILPAIHKFSYKDLLKRNLMSCSSVMVKSKLIKKYNFPIRKTTHEDYVVWQRCLREVGFAYGLNEPLLVYRMSSNSKSSSRIKSAIMTFNAYREVGFGLVSATFLTLRYAKYSISKRLIIAEKNKLKA